MITKEEALKDINDTQDFYVSKLVDIILGNNSSFDELKEVDFTSPTGTGKTVMVAKLINLLPQYFFVVTSLSKGQLRHQVERKIKQLCSGDNYIVYGSNEYSKNTILQSDDITNRLPTSKKVIWIRDEGHIATNRWQEVLRDRSSFIINFSATNKNNNGVQCNFAHTMMLRTVAQRSGTPEDALDKLIEVKKAHKSVSEYNPCALFRILNDENLDRIVKGCNKRNLKYINITDEDYDMGEICEDNNCYDVVINKFKITEGIDLKRCHVIYMDTKPGNDYTTIQVIGRARRNALFWRNDVDILDEQNKKLLEETRKCFVYYNIPSAAVEQNDFGEFVYSICDTVSVEFLKPNITIDVTNGQLANGLYVLELEGKTGSYRIEYDDELHANVVDNPTFYQIEKEIYRANTIRFNKSLSIKEIQLKDNIQDYFTISKKDNNEYDPLKIEFYVFKYLAPETNVSQHMVRYWENELKMRYKWIHVDAGKYESKFVAIYPNVIHSIRNNPEKYQEIATSTDALEYAKIIEVVRGDNDLFVASKGSIVANLYPYISKIKYLDMTPAIKITSYLEKADNVIQKGLNAYLYAPHPLVHFFESRYAFNFKAFVNDIKTTKKKTIGHCSVEYLRKMIKGMKDFWEINDYDSKVLSLSELNKVARLRMTEEEIARYIKGNYTEIETSDPNCFPKNIFDGLGEKCLPRKYQGNLWVRRKNIVEKAYVEYEAVTNDRELATYGTDTMKFLGGRFIEDRLVTSKIAKFSKLNSFIEREYKDVIENVRPQFFTCKNDYGFTKKANSCLGFCVEYFAKIKLFPKLYKYFVPDWVNDREKEKPAFLVRSAIEAYRAQMQVTYGSGGMRNLRTISMKSLLDKQYESFVNKVVELGYKTADFVREHLYGGFIDENKKPYKPDLSVKHISALCDFITHDTIMDLKCTSQINEKYIKQVLAYHYLSTKRSDLDIKRVIVYDAPTGKYIEIRL